MIRKNEEKKKFVAQLSHGSGSGTRGAVSIRSRGAVSIHSLWKAKLMCGGLTEREVITQRNGKTYQQHEADALVL